MKRLPNIIRLLLLICAAAVIPDCAKIPELHEREAEPDSRVSLSVEEARQYFESEYGTLSVTKTVNGEARVPWLMPGDITPMWEKAVESWKGNTASVDVEVIPTYRYKAVRSEFRNGKAEAYSVDVYQKLVVVKKHDDETGEDRMGQYILTLIPDKGYDRSHRGNVAERFINTGDKGSYSGLVVYFCGGLPMRIAWYENGKETGWISAFTAGDTNELLYRVSIIIRELSDIKFLRCLAVRTKYGEDIWDDWDDPWSGDEDYGGQLPPAIVYPEDNPFPGNDDWYEPPETDSYEEGGMSEGDWDSGWMLPDDSSGAVIEEPEVSPEQERINNIASTLESKISSTIENIKDKVTFRIGTPNQNTLTSSTMTMNDVFDKTTDLTFYIQPGLDETQQKLVLAHEYMHLQLLEISRNAGSLGALGRENPELMTAINTNGQDVNAGHHEYMGSHIDELETMLREAFPGESDEFYEYGKWGGGAFDSDAFDELPLSEQYKIIQYLQNNGLMSK